MDNNSIGRDLVLALVVLIATVVIMVAYAASVESGMVSKNMAGYGVIAGIISGTLLWLRPKKWMLWFVVIIAVIYVASQLVTY